MIEDNINNSNNNNYLLQNTEYINNIILTEFNMKTSQQPQMYQDNSSNDNSNLGLGCIPSTAVELPQSPEIFQTEDNLQSNANVNMSSNSSNADISCCTSPCASTMAVSGASIAAAAAVAAASTSQQAFPTPSPSPCQYASESMLPTNHTTNSSNFYPEFLQYSKEAYEQQQSNGQICNKKKKRTNTTDSIIPQAKDEHVKLSSTEIRRQIHIQSEQKRRAQIKDGFEDLRNELPSCLNKKMSKVALLHRTVQHIQHLKNSHMTILAELERLMTENEQLRKFQESVLQKQTLEMYQVNSL